jgi:hypothetical protein
VAGEFHPVAATDDHALPAEWFRPPGPGDERSAMQLFEQQAPREVATM